MINCQCCHETFRNWTYWPCNNKAKIEHEGRYYCGLHDPIRKKAKQEARDVKAAEEREQKNLEREQATSRKAIELLTELDLFQTVERVNTVKRYLR